MTDLTGEADRGAPTPRTHRPDVGLDGQTSPQKLVVADGRIVSGTHYRALDGVRGIAILLVILFHCRFIAEPTTGLEHFCFNLLKAGWIGVDLFFVLSGFLITGTLLDNIRSPHFLQNFYIRRVLRIFPLYYAVLLLGIIRELVFRGWTHEPYIYYFIYSQNIVTFIGGREIGALAHFWSLAVEEQFYLVWPMAIIFLFRRNCFMPVIILFILLVIIIRIVLISSGVARVYFFPVSHFDALLIGACLAYTLSRRGTFVRLRHHALTVGLFSIMVLFLILLHERGFDSQNFVVLEYGLFPLAMLFGSFIIVAMTSPSYNLVGKIVQNGALCYIGRVSYGLYIFHWPLIYFLLPRIIYPTDRFFLRQIAFFFTVGSISLLAASLSFRYFEQPILGIKNRIARYT
jgi:peptidoglycan/LPS O-acetylase OafA/YrhL